MRLERNFKQIFSLIRRTVDHGITKKSETKCSINNFERRDVQGLGI